MFSIINLWKRLFTNLLNQYYACTTLRQSTSFDLAFQKQHSMQNFLAVMKGSFNRNIVVLKRFWLTIWAACGVSLLTTRNCYLIFPATSIFVVRISNSLNYIPALLLLIGLAVLFLLLQKNILCGKSNYFFTQVIFNLHETQLAELKANISKSSVLKNYKTAVWVSLYHLKWHSLKLLHNAKISHISGTGNWSFLNVFMLRTYWQFFQKFRHGIHSLFFQKISTLPASSITFITTTTHTVWNPAEMTKTKYSDTWSTKPKSHNLDFCIRKY